MKSTLKNMTAVLFGITLVASAGVGAVNMITAEPIALAEQAAKVEALKGVLPAFDATTPETKTIDEMPITVYTATSGDEVVGYAVETMSKQGFGGAINLMVGFTPAGEVINVNVLKQTETPGLGTKMADEGNPLKLFERFGSHLLGYPVLLAVVFAVMYLLLRVLRRRTAVPAGK